ncbi:MAG: amidotransferase 1, exosortase A system-associated [Planctomycetota bacterium]
MCGICGCFCPDEDYRVDPEDLRRMTRSLAHRGPDGEGLRIGPGYGLGHRRLSIVDLEGGAQPMASADGGLWVVFNGEIYNHMALRAELERLGAVFRTRCDTEVLLHGYRAFGTGLAERLHGMFAFAVVDEERRSIYMARDRFGKKPIYWTRDGGALLFASELKALHAYGVRRRIRPEAVAQFLCLRYVPDPDSVLEGVQRLPPAHWMLWGGETRGPERYWRLSFANASHERTADRERRFLGLLDDSVAERLMGDVPLAPFLSGGIDSYAIAQSMARAAAGSVEACTVGIDAPGYDEREQAREAARACGIALHEDRVSLDEMLDLDWHVETYDEPFSDASAIPTYHVCRLARRHVTVALSGDGGDEAFAGYRRYLFDLREQRARRYLPTAVWRMLGRLYPKADWLPRPLRAKRTLENLGAAPDLAYARSVSASLPEEVFALLRPEIAASIGDPLEPVRAAYRVSDAADPLGRARAADIATWLCSDILVKIDRASMAVGLEARAPFLDHEMLEFAAALPPEVLLEGGRTKAFLRKALAGRLDAAALRRPKKGFSVPLRRWMRGALGDLLEERLSELRDWILPERCRSLLDRHRKGFADHSELLWACLVLARFLGRWGH